MSSFRKEKFLSLASLDYQGKTTHELEEMARQALAAGLHGLCFSAYEEGQRPGDVITEGQLRRRMEILKPHTKWVRSFSCTEGNEIIPRIAKECGLKTLVGAWLGKDKVTNQQEIENLITLVKEGCVDIAAVGNEVMYRGDLTELELLAAINQVKDAVKNVPIGYVDAYYEFEARPKIVDACNLVLANCYPFWEACSLEYALLYMKDMYRRAQRAGKGKRVIITETGWPSQGTALGGAIPSYKNYLRYFIGCQQWAKEEGIELFYFSSFDESWKVGTEGDVGAYWGLWDSAETLKF